MKCEKCGSEVQRGRTYCDKCGNKIKSNLKFDSNETNQEIQNKNINENVEQIETSKLKISYCSNCGSKIEDDNKYCKKCGSRLDKKEGTAAFYILISLIFLIISVPLYLHGLKWLSPFCIFLSFCIGVARNPKNLYLKIVLIIFLLLSLGVVSICDTCMSCPG